MRHCIFILQTEVYRQVESVRIVGAFVFAVVVLGRLTRRELAAVGARFRDNDQLTAGQLGFQRLAVPGPSDGIIVLQVVALDTPLLSLAHELRPLIHHCCLSKTERRVEFVEKIYKVQRIV